MFVTLPILVSVKPVQVQGLFDGSASLEVLKDRDMWALASPLVFKSAAGDYIVVPSGMVTDLASSPKVLDWLGFMDINGDSRLPGVLHDGIYRLGREKGKTFADNILREACIDVGLTRIEASLYWRGVKWFGKGGWDGDGVKQDYGSASANFIDKASFDAFVASGRTIYKEVA